MAALIVSAALVALALFTPGLQAGSLTGKRVVTLKQPAT
jgi:hypothetical protein